MSCSISWAMPMPVGPFKAPTFSFAFTAGAVLGFTEGEAVGVAAAADAAAVAAGDGEEAASPELPPQPARFRIKAMPNTADKACLHIRFMLVPPKVDELR
ncbi:hypothetical protein D3C86_1973400 [compost metagenome]